MKRAVSSVAVALILGAVSAAPAVAQFRDYDPFRRDPIVLRPQPSPGNVTFQVSSVASISRSGSYGTATLNLTTGGSVFLNFPAPGSVYSLAPPATLDSISSDLMFQALAAAQSFPGAFTITFQNVWRGYILGMVNFSVYRDTSMSMTVVFPGAAEWSLRRLDLQANPLLDYYGTLVMIDSHGSPRNFQMLRRQTTYTKGDGTSFTLQPLPPDSTPRTGVFDLMYWTLRSPFGLHLYGLERHPVTNDKIIHLGSWW